MEYFATSHAWLLGGNYQWFIEFQHIIILGATNAPISKVFIQYLQYFQKYWNDEKLHDSELCGEFKLINILVLWQTCVVMAIK